MTLYDLVETWERKAASDRRDSEELEKSGNAEKAISALRYYERFAIRTKCARELRMRLEEKKNETSVSKSRPA